MTVGKPTPVKLPPRRPPTDRQLNFINNLIVERDVDLDHWVLTEDPKTVDEASEVIEYLLTLPYCEDHQE